MVIINNPGGGKPSVKPAGAIYDLKIWTFNTKTRDKIHKDPILQYWWMRL